LAYQHFLDVLSSAAAAATAAADSAAIELNAICVAFSICNIVITVHISFTAPAFNSNMGNALAVSIVSMQRPLHVIEAAYEIPSVIVAYCSGARH
jgi:hypothetical protein